MQCVWIAFLYVVVRKEMKHGRSPNIIPWMERFVFLLQPKRRNTHIYSSFTIRSNRLLLGSLHRFFF